MAERIRSLRHYAPATLKQYLKLTKLTEQSREKNSSAGFIKELLADHEAIILELRERIRTIRAGKSRTATYMTGAFSSIENVLWFSLISLAFWFAPQGHEPDLMEWLSGNEETLWMSLAFSATYSCVNLLPCVLKGSVD